MQQAIMFGMLTTILNKGKVTAKELSLKFEISKRTVLRYIDAMCVAKIPLITCAGRNGGVKISDNFTLNKIFFTEQELKRLYDCITGMLSKYDDSISRSIKDKLCNITLCQKQQILSSNTLLIDSGDFEKAKNNREIFNFLEKSINLCLEITIFYRDLNDSIMQKTIHPHSLVFKTGWWFIYAYCIYKNKFLLFKISQITKISLTKKTFVKQDVDINTLPYNLNWFENEKNVNIKLKVSKEIKSEVEHWLNSDNVMEHKDGNIYAFASLPERGLIQKLVSFGNKIMIIEPNDFKQKLLKTINQIEKLYENEEFKTVN